MENLFTVAEFSKRAGVTQQCIYKRKNNKDDVIHKYIIYRNGQTLIKESALNDLYNKSSNDTATEQKTAETEKIILLLEEENKSLKKQLEEKAGILDIFSQQLKEKDKQIETLSQTLIQQQQLNALQLQKNVELLEYKEKKSIFNIFKKRGINREEKKEN